jgi:hypothetical protein
VAASVSPTCSTTPSKWLMSGSARSVIGVSVTFASVQTSAIPHAIVAVLGIGALAFPVSIAVGILRYRLYEIERLISRTLSYLLVTGCWWACSSGWLF